MVEDSQLLLLWNGFWDTQDERLNIEAWHFKITFDNVSLLVEHEIFLKFKLHVINLHISRKLHYQFEDL